ncbi:hypothetical protein ACIA8C_28750 [Nocardia sp. NPDC051321]|uniref:hypothetical protein n=1 Tax=Nocardia sp. NPDC051321 TaxID=3364323 RepID=UPI0037AE9525
MKKTVVIAAMLAGLVAPAGLAAAAPVSAPAPADTVAGPPTGSSSTDIFCGVLWILKGGGNADCSF